MQRDMNEQMESYCRCMQELKDRLAAVAASLDRALTTEPDIYEYEHVALQFRKILELIAFGSLVANSEAYSRVHKDFAKHWNAKRLLTNLRAMNADYFPKPLEYSQDTSGAVRFDHVSSEYLTEVDFVDLYTKASRVLHASNPFAESSGITFGYTFQGWYNRIGLLMRLHQIRLIGNPLHWIVQLVSPRTGHPVLLAAVEVREEG
jgi:hypothetical protein